jgi:hypothetical protein
MIYVSDAYDVPVIEETAKKLFYFWKKNGFKNSVWSLCVTLFAFHLMFACAKQGTKGFLAK